MNVIWNTKLIFDHLGGTDGVRNFLTALSPVPPTPGTVAVWKHRGRISYEWMPVLVRGWIGSGQDPALLTCVEAAPVPVMSGADCWEASTPEDVGL